MVIKFNLDRIMFEKNNMKVPELQELTGLNKNTLYAFYKGDLKRVDVETLEKLCTALDCQPGDLLLHIKGEQK